MIVLLCGRWASHSHALAHAHTHTYRRLAAPRIPHVQEFTPYFMTPKVCEREEERGQGAGGRQMGSGGERDGIWVED